ncbi:MerR family transcriptional regulator [Paenibacillus sp. FSL R7-0331]|uniref:MerR family transcriptional regulator n=1 Tax=Paenibacillus sp. FSL R7-0331 TaxID=1536773 RepID=UPI0004F765CF|nr:MerR family transcriptional regulator [Paenibacillus sp. FSL R7-0331]AIQ55407.1 MerR family transcriptional regulator [Paenibacillus sp. FSL R7-0331]
MFTIGQIAKRVGLNIGAIRFYERKGLLEPAVRNEQNNRLYSEEDIGWLEFLKCLRETGMSVEEIKRYYDMVKTGTSTLPERTRMIEEQKQVLLDDIEKKKEQLVHLEHKLERYYRGENY